MTKPATQSQTSFQLYRLTRRPLPSIFVTIALIVSFVLTLLCFVAFQPPSPRLELDPSWMYAVDFGSAHRMPFGRALIFTFGPLVSLYTDLRVPENDGLYLIFQSILTVGIFSGFLINSDYRRRVYILLLPLLLVNLIVKDAILFLLPLTLVLAACRRRMAPHSWGLGLALVAISDGLLPLIKGTTIVCVSCCTVLGCAALLRDRSPWAFIVPLLTVASGVIAWLATGQHLSDGPFYLATQFHMASQYTDAMAIFGASSEIVIFVILGVAIGSLFLTERRHRLVLAIAILCTGFVAFKAGFVRHDGHAFIAGTCLGLLGLLLHLHDPAPRAYVGLLLGSIGWFVIAGSYFPMDGSTMLSRFTSRVGDSSSALVMRLTHSAQLYEPFEQAKDAIRTKANLPPIDGTVDIYPVDIAALLASDLKWDPRPVIQSYSAYTSTLATLNAQHLEGEGAPENVVFGMAPIDDRFPSLEDGASWPKLLSHYDFRSSSGPYALLKRSNVDHHAVIGAPVTSGSFRFDQEIPVPPGVRNVWASLRFKPRAIGRLVSFVFKLPILTLQVTFASAERQNFRMIAGMAENFLLSPVVQSAKDYVALSSGDAESLAAQEVRSFTISQGSTYPFWGTRFDVSLSSLTFQPHDEAAAEVHRAHAEGQPLAQLPEGAECSIELVDGKHPGPEGVITGAQSAVIQGWGLLSSSRKLQSHALQIAVTDGMGRTFYSDAIRLLRPDINTHFGLPEGAEAGFSSTVDLRGLHGAYRLHVVQQGSEGLVSCAGNSVSITRP